MAASSPYQQNDYQGSSNYRPYELPVNDIFKALVAQNQFWEIGAQRVKSVYDNALNLRLSLEPNRQLRDQFMKDAEKQLTKLSSKDVTRGDVQREGFNIFKPLLQDEGIMYDDAMTRHYDKVREDALAYREKDNGKGYSDTNMGYALDGYNEFVNSKDRMAGKAFYSKRKEYTPFYDPTQELTNILKNCKPSTAHNESVQGYYINSYSDEALSSAKINACLDGGLSDKAKRQLQINGYMTYKNQPDALAEKYIPHLSGTVAQLQEENSAIKGVLANRNNLKSLKKEDLAKIGVEDASEITPAFLQNLDNKVKLNEQRILNMNTSIGKLLSKDFSDISGDNYEPVAGAMYSRDYIQNVAEGFSYNFSKNTMKADPVQMMFYQQAQQNARQEDQQQFELDKMQKQLEADLIKKQADAAKTSGDLKGLLTGDKGNQILDLARSFDTTKSPFSEIDKGNSYDAVTKKREEIRDQRVGVNQWLIQKMKSYGLDADVTHTDDKRFENFWANFKTTSSGDPVKKQVVDDYYNKISPLISYEDLLRTTQENVDKAVKPLEQDLERNISQIKPITIKVDGKNVNITGRDIFNTLTGKSSPITIIKGSQGTTSTSSTGVPINSGYIPDQYLYNGRPVESTYGKQGYPLHEMIRDISSKYASGTEASRKKRDELMKSETVLQNEIYNFAWLNSNVLSDPTKGETPTFKETLAGKIGLPLKYIDDLNVGETDLKGRLVVSLNTNRKDAKKEYDAKQVLENLKNYGGRNNLEVKGKEDTFVLEGLSNLQVINTKDMASIMPPYIRALEKQVTNTSSKSTGFIRAQNGKSYRLEIGKSADGNFDYTIISESSPLSPIKYMNDRQQALVSFQQLLGQKGEENIK